jgi:tRNA(Ile)-lysidine synthase
MRRQGIQQALLQSLPEDAALCVAFSGGLDSTVLLHALAGLRREHRFSLRALHVNHGLQAAAGAWEAHCTALASSLQVPCSAARIVVRNDAGQGLEAAAREARYCALRASLQPAEWLLTAHHADDQLETVLLHLFRGSGVEGLAGIPRTTVFGPGRLCRPLLDVPAEALVDYGANVLIPQGLGWLTDPMNGDPAFDRGYLRHLVTPILRRRFPAAAGGACRSATLAAEAAGLLEELARADAHSVADEHRLSLEALGKLSPARQRNLIRFQARERGWAVPPERRLREGLAQLWAAGPGRQPVLGWSGHEIRRFRQYLHLIDVASSTDFPDATPLEWSAGSPLVLGGVRGQLSLSPAALFPAPRHGAPPLSTAVVADGLQVAFRSGGERLRTAADRHHRTLKYLFQTRGIVPWMRGHLPLVFAGRELAAVGNLWTADWAAARAEEAGLQIVWTGHAPIR